MAEYKVKDIVNLPYEEIDRIQESINTDNLKIIEQAFAQKRINAEERDYLYDFYHDGMGVYREVYRALYEIFKHPEYTCAFDLKTGKVDRDVHEAQINYGLKAVTPFTSTRLEYVDKFNNPIYVIFPKMKSAERAIEKLESEYRKEYANEFSKQLHDFFMNEDREAFVEKIQNIRKGSAKLHDILRLTITCKYFTDVERIKRVMTENKSDLKRNYRINSNETRDRFLKPLKDNEKRYYDIKMIMHQQAPGDKELDVEVQLKIHTLYNADLRTHKIYEDVRTIEADLVQNGSLMPNKEKRQKEAKIKILNNKIRHINENAVHQYNMMVIDKARRIEDDGYRPLRVNPDYEDGTYQQCRHFINREYLVESYENFNALTAFSADNTINKLCFMRMIGKLEPDFNEYDEKASETIAHHFSQLTIAEKERFDGINEVAKRYAPLIQRKIHTRKHEELANGNILIAKHTAKSY